MAAYEWIVTNGPAIMAIWGAFVTFASTVVKYTKTTKDDAVLDAIVNFLEKFSIFNKNA